MDMVSLLQDLVAPRARASVACDLKGSREAFLSNLKLEHKLLSDGGNVNKFRVKGSFFSDLRATQVLVGKKAKPKYYAKVGFFLEVLPQESNQIILKAEERVILGYLETKAVGIALSEMLKSLVARHDKNENASDAGMDVAKTRRPF